MQHRANRNAPGRHRLDGAPGRHRAPAGPLLPERGRTVALSAALLAGIGVTGVTATTATAGTAADASSTPVTSAAQAEPAIAETRTPADPGTPADSSVSAVDYDLATATAAVPSGELSSAPVRLKPRPAPTIVARWVNPLPEAGVTSCFGPRWGRLHAGVDLAAPDGTPIRAAGAGVVVTAGPADGYGNAVLIDHGNGYLTHYGHMSRITVIAGQHVTPGQQVGNEGSTGHSTGPHLHFEVHDGYYQNPIEPTAWLHARGVDIPGCVPLAGDEDHDRAG